MSQDSLIEQQLYISRRTLLTWMEKQGYNVDTYANFSMEEINLMYKESDELMDMMFQQENKQTLIKYHVTHKLSPKTVDEMADILFGVDGILNPQTDTLYIVVMTEINDSLNEKTHYLFETQQIHVVLVPIQRLLFNIFDHALSLPHTILTEQEQEQVQKKYNITSLDAFPKLSRFDPMAKAIGIRPKQVCSIQRGSKTAIKSVYYRVCV